MVWEGRKEASELGRKCAMKGFLALCLTRGRGGSYMTAESDSVKDSERAGCSAEWGRAEV